MKYVRIPIIILSLVAFFQVTSDGGEKITDEEFQEVYESYIGPYGPKVLLKPFVWSAPSVDNSIATL